jgi:hypothetical protein
LDLAVQPTGASGTARALDEQLEIIALLLRHGADPMAADGAGRTPEACAKNEKIVMALRLKGATRSALDPPSKGRGKAPRR